MSAKHKPSMESIANELEGASVFFNSSPAKANKARMDEAREAHGSYASPEAHEAQEASASPEASPTRKVRKTIRRPFVVYEDQLVELREIKARSVLDGNPLEIQDMVQEALDTYIKRYYAKHPKR